MFRIAALLFAMLLLSASSLPPAAAQEKEAQAQAAALAERLPPKIEKIQNELPAWLQKTGNKEALTLMNRLGEQVKSKQFLEAEATADSLLKMMGENALGVSPNAQPSGVEKNDTRAPRSADATTKRLTEKVERLTIGVQKWAANGHDPAEILMTMQEKFQPLMAAGKIAEAEAVVDNVLKKIGMDPTKPVALPANKPSADKPSANEPSAEERVLTKIHLIQKERSVWLKKTDKQAESDALMQTLREQLASMNFAEAEKTADAIMKLMGLSIAQAAPAAQAAHAGRPAPTAAPHQAADPLGAFFPQQLIFVASARIALTPAQLDALLAYVKESQPRLEELKAALENETAALKKLTSQEPLEESLVLAQLNKFLDIEREAKQLQTVLGVKIHNLLTATQKAKLRELATNPDAVAKLEEEFQNRITAKLARVTAVAQNWAQGGRDLSRIAQAMEQKVRPLMDSGRVIEAETEIDRVLEQFSEALK